MFVNCSGPGVNLSIPNILKDPSTQAPLGPMPDNAMHNAATGFSSKVLYKFLPGHTLITKIPRSVAAPSPGFLSNMVMSQCAHVKASMSVFNEGKPVTRVTDQTLQNQGNGSGMTTAPSQNNVMVNK